MLAPGQPLFEEEKDYINPDHIHAFAKALEWNDDASEMGVSSPRPEGSPSDISKSAELIDEAHLDLNSISLAPVTKPDRISSVNDWFPINNKQQNTKKIPELLSKTKSKREKLKNATKKLSNEFRSSASYTLLRWPVLVVIAIWVLILCILYTSVRAYVALLEYYFTWVGERKRLRDNLRKSKSYQEWIDNAVKLDKYLNLDKWSINPKFSYYDSHTVRLTTSRLKHLRGSGNVRDLVVLLQGCLKKNFAGIENKQLYSHRYYGTKNLVAEYVAEVVTCIDIVADSTEISFDAKRKFFRIVLKNYGKSALCLSGGACFAYVHFGIVKALLDNNLLPSIISGTSCGGLIAAITCLRTDEELKKLLVPQLARKITACEDPWYVWIPRFWKTGARFDAVAWARKSNFFTRGSTTFAECYERTGRILNVSTVPADPHSPVILCNNITSPNCVVWSSLLASAAVPGILNPVVLMIKDPATNEVTPFSLGSKWRDGSLRTDIPIDALNAYYNVNFSIVSQVNPHISLFFFAPKGTVGRPVASSRRKTRREKYASLRGGFIATALEQLFKLEIRKWLEIVKHLDLLPHLLEQDWLNVWLQRFSGSITIWPRNRLKDFYYILSDPSEEQLQEKLEKGERSIYPKLLFIKHRLTIERAIERGRKLTRLSNTMSELSATPSIGAREKFNITTVDYRDSPDSYETDSNDEDYIPRTNGGLVGNTGSLDSYDEDEDDDYIPSTDEGHITDSSVENHSIKSKSSDSSDKNIIQTLLRRNSENKRRNTVT